MQYQTLPINSIKVENRIRKNPQNIKPLAENIQSIGLLSPIIVNQQNVLLAGERRLCACRSLGWNDIDVIIKETADVEQDILTEISENIHREEFTREEVIDAGIRLERIETIKARERQSTSTGGSNPQLVENFPTAEKGRVRDIIAQKIGISGKQYSIAKKIVENKDSVPPGVYDDWNLRRISTNKVHQLLKDILEGQVATVTSTPTVSSAPIAPKTQEPKEVIKEVVPDDYVQLQNTVKELTATNQRFIDEINHLKANAADDSVISKLKDDYDALMVQYQTVEENLRNAQEDNERLRQSMPSTSSYAVGTGTVLNSFSRAASVIKNELAPLIYNSELDEASDAMISYVDEQIDNFMQILQDIRHKAHSGKVKDIIDVC